MAEFVFTSPGIKFRERDLSFVTRNVGVTTLGLVGETQKGPAFEPVLIQDKNQFNTRFGFQSNEKFSNGQLRYHLPYVAKAYLEESNQLYITRVLGLSGYQAGNAYALTLSAGIDLSTTGTSGSAVAGTFSYTDNSYLGVTISASGVTGSVFSGYTKTSSTEFSGDLISFTANTYTSGAGSGVTSTVTYTGTSYSDYEDMVLAVIRSKASVADVTDAAPVVTFDATGFTISANNTNTETGDLFSTFDITTLNEDGGNTYTVSLDPDSKEYLPSVIGNKPKGKNTDIWVERIYPNLIRKLDADGLAYGVNTTVISADTATFTDYTDQYKTPETPWIVSELRGNQIERLFKLISISDGDAANSEIKVSITSIDPASKEFNVIIRDFNDTDENPVVLESFTRCTMRTSEANFIGNRIGTSDGDYPLRSEYIMIELDTNYSQDAFPAGFEGYNQNDWSASATTSGVEGIAPKLFYKTGYSTTDKYSKTFLGISENGYDGTSLEGDSIDQNQFKYKGKGGFVKSKGFHMDSGATGTYYDGTLLIGEFEVGAGKFRTNSDINSGTDTYFELNSRKFTLVPAGGFDGWDVHRLGRTHTDRYRAGGFADGVEDGETPSNDFQAWETAIDTFANPEDITINLFATPGLNWSDNLRLVNDTIDMIETERTDSLYIVDSPDIDVSLTIGSRIDVTVANDIADSFDAAAIDSSYAATYYPWIQQIDTDNSVRVYLPPTAEVVKAIAFTDNVKFPWFAPAGLQRGVTGAIKSKYKMSQEARDILYNARINPMADFNDVGTAIFGQKTLQVKESALDRINVRRLLLQAKVLISNIAIRLVFEQNDQTTIDQFLSKANPILDSIRRERGLDDFQIIMDDSNNSPESKDRNELYGEIKIKPTRTVEYIGLTFTITPSGASFEDI